MSSSSGLRVRHLDGALARAGTETWRLEALVKPQRALVPGQLTGPETCGNPPLPTARLIIPERSLTSGVAVSSRSEFSEFELQTLEDLENEGTWEF
ncbi:hypothetical protein DL769_010900 [Monosporascus sp. CRB-8-3]|nr:hypothetical protein DL769_010900 [Monosporascus sp. CRB-8-3]